MLRTLRRYVYQVIKRMERAIDHVGTESVPTLRTMKIFRKELTSQYPASVLAIELARPEKIVYSINGNRSESPQKFLTQVEQVAEKIGLTRVADISYLSPAPYPVYQSCRPAVYLSQVYGQNSGAQGKGSTSIQAKISCIMESIEGYCAEPRVPDLVRGTYNFLRHQHLIVNPTCFIHRSKRAPHTDEPLMWTPAYSTRIECTVLVPAEAVYFPFISNYYETRGIFISGSSGLAAGATYLEATIHALYELIERYYIYCMEVGMVNIEALFEHELNDTLLQSLGDRNGADYLIQLYCLQLPNIKNLPMIQCCLVTGDAVYSGWGCSATLDISLSRAISEALQARATHISGSREDMGQHSVSNSTEDGTDEFFGRSVQPEERTLHLNDLRRLVHNHQFTSLNEEYAFIKAWLSDMGLDNILIANLTRHGIDIPVVKAIIPNMEAMSKLKLDPENDFTDLSPLSHQFSIKSKKYQAEETA